MDKGSDEPVYFILLLRAPSPRLAFVLIKQLRGRTAQISLLAMFTGKHPPHQSVSLKRKRP